MFSFTSPSQSRLGSIGSRMQALESQGQQQAGINAAGPGIPTPTQTAVGIAPGAPGAGGTPTPAASSPQETVADIYHAVMQRLGGSATSPNPYADMTAPIQQAAAAQGAPVNVSSSAGSSDLVRKLASYFGV